ncbi:hypothetical protein MRX96_039235 [Rhipicephalus microplus]
MCSSWSAGEPARAKCRLVLSYVGTLRRRPRVPSVSPRYWAEQQRDEDVRIYRRPWGDRPPQPHPLQSTCRFSHSLLYIALRHIQTMRLCGVHLPAITSEPVGYHCGARSRSQGGEGGE